ncbi:hypothetical protein [Azospirillum sp. TSH64]|uniref:hypothetical protein n=1 Tax=Azospirillum sp. TSH64 TaxID=652740 RepID=UPI000D605039|nr:hypothetical protein [Azospirillum sp. TSH64]PWC75249.1 hypothetical protein TSH64_10020 [Azospirillum sp. TSH64]
MSAPEPIPGHEPGSARYRDRMIGLFLLAAALFSPPLLGLFSVKGTILGVPILYGWVFGIWAAVIALAALAGRAR